MAPRRGGGGSTSGSGGGSSSGSGSGDDGYDHSLYFQPDERRAMYAQIVCASLVVLAAIAALAMVVGKSWLGRDGTRNKPRLLTFLTFLTFVIINRSITVAVLALELQGPNYLGQNDADQWESVYEYYRSSSFTVKRFVGGMFGWLSTSLLLALVLFEVSRPSVHDTRKHVTFEVVVFMVILAFAGVTAANWIMSAIESLGPTLHRRYFNIYVSLGLALASAGLVLFFATIMYFSKNLSASSTDPAAKRQPKRLRLVITTLWLTAALDVVAQCLIWWGPRDHTPSIAMFAAEDALWIILILGMALLAWKSHQSYRPVLTYDPSHGPEPSLPGGQQPTSTWGAYPPDTMYQPNTAYQYDTTYQPNTTYPVNPAYQPNNAYQPNATYPANPADPYNTGIPYPGKGFVTTTQAVRQ